MDFNGWEVQQALQEADEANNRDSNIIGTRETASLEENAAFSTSVATAGSHIQYPNAKARKTEPRSGKSPKRAESITMCMILLILLFLKSSKGW